MKCRLNQKRQEDPYNYYCFFFLYLSLSFLFLGMELLGKKHRSLASTATNLFGVFGTIVATLIAYLTRDWQYFQAGLAALCLPVIIGYL